MTAIAKGWARFMAAATLVGCGGSEPREAAAPVKAAATASVAAPATTPAIVPSPVVRTTASATPTTPVIPEQLSNAPRLIYRSLDTGALVTKSTLVTRTLQRLEDRALLTVETQISRTSTFQPVVGPFEAPTVRRYIGTATTTGEVTTFNLVDGDEKLVLECAMGEVRVAAATAVREADRRAECGDRGVWTPASTERVRALRCGIDKRPVDPTMPPDRSEGMAFVAAPGIELLFINDDCATQGAGYRFVPANAEVMAIRPRAL